VTGRHWFRARLVKDGPYIGVMTFFGGPLVDGEEVDRSPRWQALVRGETTGRVILMGEELPIEVDGVALRNVEPVTESEWRFLVADDDHAGKYRPDDPKANPRKPVNFHKYLPF
jgi:hypothetical protein